MTPQDLQKCRELAKKVRIHCLEMVCKGKSGHIGSMLSMADILPVIYTQILNVDPANPDKADRDRFILSKGHGGAALLATLAELGFFPLEWLDQYYCDNGKLSGHISHHIPGVEFSTGSLGHGLPVAKRQITQCFINSFLIMSIDFDGTPTENFQFFFERFKVDNIFGFAQSLQTVVVNKHGQIVKVMLTGKHDRFP